MLCKTSGSWVKYAFTGDRVVFISEEALQGAQLDIYIDNVLVDTIESWTGTSSINNRQTVVFDSEDYDLAALGIDLTKDSHEFKIVGTTGDQGSYRFPIFRVDAFDEYPDAENIASTTELAKLIAEVSALTETSYTTDSWNDLQTALEAAQAVMADPSATETQVEEAYNNLVAARDALDPADAKITEVTELMPVCVPYGITADGLKEVLQDSVVVTTEGGQKIHVNVEWNLDEFDGT